MDTKYIESEIYERAVQDADFREKLRKNPEGTLAAEFGAKLPEGMNVQVHEQSESTLHLVIPPEQTDKITDEDLATVAGGAMGTATFYGTFVEYECIDCDGSQD